MFDKDLLRHWTAFKRAPLSYLGTRLSSIIYDIKCYFHPETL